MKNAKSIIFALLAITLSFITVQAQQAQGRQGDPEARAEKQTARMTEQLSLDKKQAEEIKAINLKYGKIQQEKRDKAMKEREAMRKENQKVNDVKMAELKKVLTEEQFAKLETQRKEKGNRKAGFRGRGNVDPEKRAGVMTDRMVEKLGLNDDQAEKVRTINYGYAKQMTDMRDKNGENHDRSAMKKLRDDRKEALKKVLTPEQLTEWEKAGAEKGKGHRGKKRWHQGNGERF